MQRTKWSKIFGIFLIVCIAFLVCLTFLAYNSLSSRAGFKRVSVAIMNERRINYHESEVQKDFIVFGDFL